jgi:FixJ family two-component response regulator
MSDVERIEFVVHDDVSAREAVESLIRCEGWQPDAFATAQEFLDSSSLDYPRSHSELPRT